MAPPEFLRVPGTGLPRKSPMPSAGKELASHTVLGSDILCRSLNVGDSALGIGLKPLNGTRRNPAVALSGVLHLKYDNFAPSRIYFQTRP